LPVEGTGLGGGAERGLDIERVVSGFAASTSVTTVLMVRTSRVR